MSGRFILVLRMATLSTVVAMLIWLPYEDAQIYTVQFFAIILSILVYLWVIRRAREYNRIYIAAQAWSAHLLLSFAAVGLLAGLLVSPVGLFLMIFKSGLHAHGTFEYSIVQAQDILSLWWVWGLLGMAVGSVAGLILLGKNGQTDA